MIEQADDEVLAQKINAFLAANKYTTRHKVMKACNTSVYRMDRLEKAGLVKLPLKLTPKISASMSRRTNAWSKGFRI